MFPQNMLKRQFGCCHHHHHRTKALAARRAVVPPPPLTSSSSSSRWSSSSSSSSLPFSRLLPAVHHLNNNTRSAHQSNNPSWSLNQQFGSRWWWWWCRSYCSTIPKSADTVPIIYVEADGSEKEVEAEIGKNLLEVAHDNNVELEGACGGELACSTCHLVFEQSVYDTLPEKSEEEEDMLDLAFEVTETSRLGCQIIVREDFSGVKVRIPDDGF